MAKRKIWIKYRSTKEGYGSVDSKKYDILVNLFEQDIYPVGLDPTSVYLSGEPNIAPINQDRFPIILQVKIRAKKDETESNIITHDTISYGQYRKLVNSGENSVNLWLISDTENISDKRAIVIGSEHPLTLQNKKIATKKKIVAPKKK